jgi:hypothetical protein
MCPDQCKIVAQATQTDEAHQHSSTSDQDHHDDRCICACHGMALEPARQDAVPTASFPEDYFTLTCSLPSIVTLPPDHIPLV